MVAKYCIVFATLLFVINYSYAANPKKNENSQQSFAIPGAVNGIRYSLPVGLFGSATILLLTPVVPGIDKAINPELFALTTALAGGILGAASTNGIENKEQRIRRSSTAGLLAGFAAFSGLCLAARYMKK